jgi:S-adenosylmethionine synthetase
LPTASEVQLAYAIGVAEPVSILHGNLRHRQGLRAAKSSELVRKNFELTPKGIIESLNLRRPIFQKTAAYGHFGRTGDAFTWEATDKAEALKAGAQAELAAK